MEPGTQLAHYRIAQKLGEGGMGEVYEAEDERLKRQVAIKVLPDALARDPERLARLEREAQVLASIEHPSIAAIYGLEESGATRFLVMQLAEGATLADRIGEGPLPLGEALRVALQIAQGLEAAHERGVVHRDLKPANVQLAPDGTVKILDFGLAKAFAPDGSPSSPQLSASPTVLQATQAGVILGTAAYMSPEQARGQAVDRRTDIWAFGAVLYEMLTGAQAFPGDTATDVLGGIVHKEPDWDALPADTPRRIRALLLRCLRKEQDRRIQAIGDARVSIEEYLEDPVAAEAILDAGAGAPATGRATWLPWVVAAAPILVLVGSFLLRDAPAPEPATLRLDIALGMEGALRVPSLGSSAILNPGGSSLAVIAGASEDTTALHVRRLDSTDYVNLAGSGAYNPFFSPDGAWVGFVTPSELRRVPVTGGTPLTIAEVSRSRGATWTHDGRIVIAASPFSGLDIVDADGGELTPLTTLAEDDGEATHRWPHALPDGRTILFTSHSAMSGEFDAAAIKTVDLESGEQKIVYRGGYYARYAESGHLLFVNAGTLFAAPFDLGSLEVVGSAVPVAENLASHADQGGAQYDVSRTGTLIYRMGSSGPQQYPAVWLDRDNEVTPLLTDERTYVEARVSPDGRRVLMTELNGNNWDVWVYDTVRGTRSRLTFAEGIEGPAVWSPDGREVIYSSDVTGADELYRKAADGSGEAVQLTDEGVALYVSDWSSSGRYVLMTRIGPPDEEIGWHAGTDIAYIDLEEDPITVRPYLATTFGESEAEFSPNDRWVVYQSTESGRSEVYVRPFPPAPGRWQVSDQGGAYGRWSADGTELYYRTDEGISVVQVETAGSFGATRPRPLANGNFIGGTGGVPAAGSTFADYDVAPDGRFVMFPRPGDETPNVQLLRLVANWFPELRRVAPPR